RVVHRDQCLSRKEHPGGWLSTRCSESRLPMNQPVSLTVFPIKEPSIRYPARLVDASRTAVEVVIDSAVDAGEVVEVRADGGVVYGQVEYCRAALGGGFRIGVVIEEGLSGEWLIHT